jgi:glycerol-3-phosphate acyltransferase PlsY
VQYLLPILAYLLGSVSFAYWAGRINGIDLREHGSKNLGATNAGRVLGMRWFAIVFTLDLGKGFIAVYAAQMIPNSLPADQQHWLILATASAVVLGHIFSCYHRFKGGKAVATSLGVLAALLPTVAGLSLGVWLVVWLFGWLILRSNKSRAVGPASVISAIAAPVIAINLAENPWAMPQLPMTILILAISVLVVVRHRTNIAKWFS